MGWNTCYTCKCRMWIDDSLDEAAKRNRGAISFFYSYGHQQHYVQGETEETKLRRERDRLQQQIAQRDDEIAAQGRKIKRLNKRASAGICPCCQRTFSNMAQHMKHQHPEFVAEGGAKVVPLKRSSFRGR